MRIYLTLLLLLGCANGLFAQQKPDTLFFESFDGTSLDRTKWNVEVNGRTDNNEQQAYIDSIGVLSIKNGLLNITPFYRPGFSINNQRKYDFVSGRINTRNKYEFVYGTISARLKTTAGEGLWPAFWILGKGKWPDAGEVDIMETVGDSSWTSNAIHGPAYFGNTPLQKRNPFAKGSDVTQWHTYTVRIDPANIIFSVDGKETYKVNKETVEQYGKWVFDNKKYLLLNFALGGGYPQGVNKVTKPYPGLSQTSVNKIKAGKVEYLVDWVLITSLKE